jgi:hypothetical protein
MDDQVYGSNSNCSDADVVAKLGRSMPRPYWKFRI